MERTFERVYTVTDYYDGPRAGFADFDGVPHAYRAVFRDDLDDWDPYYRLFPVDDEVFALALEDWALWERWQDAYYAGETPYATHPALPADAARHAEIAPVIEAVLETPPASCRLALAEFRPADPRQSRPAGRMRDLEVRWTPADATEPDALVTTTGE